MNKESLPTVLVTGGSRGIGLAISTEFTRKGFHVLAPTRAQLDLGDSSSIANFIKKQQDSNIGVLINNAGINEIAEVSDITADSWQRIIDVNLTAPFLLAQGFAPGMKEKKWGRILNTGSIFGHVTRAGRCPYATAKSGLLGLTRSLAVELAPFNILVNTLCPGYVQTEMTQANNSSEQLENIARTIPLGRLAQPEEIARIAVFLCSPENTYLTGQSIVADGGFTSL